MFEELYRNSIKQILEKQLKMRLNEDQRFYEEALFIDGNF